MSSSDAARVTASRIAVIIPFPGTKMTEEMAAQEWRPMLPPELFTPDIGPDGIAVYGALCLYVDGKTGDCWPSHETVGKRIGMTRKRVIEAIKVLEKGGLVGVTRQDDRGMKRSNLYHLHHQKTANVQMSRIDTSTLSNGNDSSAVAGQQMSPTGTADVPYRDSRCAVEGHEPYVIEPNDIELEKGDTPLTPQNGEPAAPVEVPTFPAPMEAFWNTYDAKGRERSSRSQVLSEWKRLKPNETTVALIMESVAEWSASQSWRDGFALGAHRFLKLRKWTEHPAPKKSQPSANGWQGNKGNDDAFRLVREQAMKRQSAQQEPTDVIDVNGVVR